MKDKIRIFLDSDQLEQYLLGTLSHEETLQVERYIAMYPEVRQTYIELQENLECYARMHAIAPPDGLKDRILRQVRAENRGRKKFYSYLAAACVVAMIFAGTSYVFWSQNQSLQEENIIVNSKIENLEKSMRLQLEEVRNQFIVLNNPKTKRLQVTGNNKAKELKAVAYINPVKKLSYINVSKLPDLPGDQCFQMWAEVNGKMLNLGIIKEAPDSDKLMALPYGKNAFGYITIEPNGGNTAPTIENIVANIRY